MHTASDNNSASLLIRFEVLTTFICRLRTVFLHVTLYSLVECCQSYGEIYVQNYKASYRGSIIFVFFCSLETEANHPYNTTYQSGHNYCFPSFFMSYNSSLLLLLLLIIITTATATITTNITKYQTPHNFRTCNNYLSNKHLKDQNSKAPPVHSTSIWCFS